MTQEDINKLTEAKQYFDAIAAGFAVSLQLAQAGYQSDQDALAAKDAKIAELQIKADKYDAIVSAVTPITQ